MSVPVWITSLDNTMIKWINQFTCPGLAFIPGKPWPLNNDVYTIACVVSDIMYTLQLAKFNDRTRQILNPMFSNI